VIANQKSAIKLGTCDRHFQSFPFRASSPLSIETTDTLAENLSSDDGIPQEAAESAEADEKMGGRCYARSHEKCGSQGTLVPPNIIDESMFEGNLAK
jgi:hypothetical protein